jgi:hypothetical protein
MSTALRQPHQPAPSLQPPSLWRELVDGSAGPVVRAGVSLALAPLLAGAALIGSYILAGLVPAWAYNWNGRFSPTDELVGCMMALASLAYVAGLLWLWTRSRYKLHEFWKAGLRTMAVALVTTVLGAMLANIDFLRSSFDVLMMALLCFAITLVILTWVQAGRRFVRGRPLYNPADGAIDLRCPSCGYRMVGLRESRCPECGSAYTLDELVARQEFLNRAGAPLAAIAPGESPSKPRTSQQASEVAQVESTAASPRLS